MSHSPRDESSDVVHVVIVDVDSYCSRLDALSPAELQRYHRFVLAGDRRRYAAAHAAVRHLLAAICGRRASSLEFAIGPKGKPALPPSAHDERFNLSHSGDLALVALARCREVGIDVEQHRRIDDHDSLAAVSFSPLERAALRRFAHEPARLEAFYRGWTRKESFVKAIGQGLSCPLDAFDVSLDEAPAQGLLSCRLPSISCSDWSIANIASAPGYSAALTVEGRGCRIETWHGVDAFVRSDACRDVVHTRQQRSRHTP